MKYKKLGFRVCQTSREVKNNKLNFQVWCKFNRNAQDEVAPSPSKQSDSCAIKSIPENDHGRVSA